MDVSVLSSLSGLSNVSGTSYIDQISKSVGFSEEEQAVSFDDVLSSMMDAVDETNTLQNLAEQEEIRFALGESENTHELQIAMTKANTALQYTVAVRDKLIDAYREIMQMSI